MPGTRRSIFTKEEGPHKLTLRAARAMLAKAEKLDIPQPAERLAVELKVSVATFYRYCGGNARMSLEAKDIGDNFLASYEIGQQIDQLLAKAPATV